MIVWMLSRFVKKLLMPFCANFGKMKRYALTAGFSTQRSAYELNR